MYKFYFSFMQITWKWNWAFLVYVKFSRYTWSWSASLPPSNQSALFWNSPEAFIGLPINLIFFWRPFVCYLFTVDRSRVMTDWWWFIVIFLFIVRYLEIVWIRVGRSVCKYAIGQYNKFERLGSLILFEHMSYYISFSQKRTYL